MSSRRRPGRTALVVGAVAAVVLITAAVVIVPEARSRADVHRAAEADAADLLSRVSVLAVEDARGLDPSDYVDAVRQGRAWPRPTLADRTDLDAVDDDLPRWADGATFGVMVTGADSEDGAVLVDHAVPGEASTGSGFNSRVDRVLVCVRIAVPFPYGVVDAAAEPTVDEIPCRREVLAWYTLHTPVSLAEVERAGRGG